MNGKSAVFYITQARDFVFPQVSGTKAAVESYLNKTQNIEWTTQATLYPDIDFDFNIYGNVLKFRYVQFYILVKYDNPEFYNFLNKQNQNSWFSIPLFKTPSNQYVARFIMSYDNQVSNKNFNLWVGLYA